MAVLGRLARAANWRYAAGEILLIFVGVSIALAASSWYESHQARNDEISAITVLRTTLAEDLKRLETEQDIIRQAHRGMTELLGSLETGGYEEQELSDGLHLTTRFVTISLRNGPYETLKARGINLISRESLRTEITTLFEDEIPNLTEDSVIDRQLVRNRILPFMLEWFNLDADQRWVLKAPESEAWRRDLITLIRLRSRTLDRFYLPSFERTVMLTKDLITEIDSVIPDEEN